MSNAEIAEFLREISILLELAGENPFKTQAYQTAARNIEQFSLNMADSIKGKKFPEIKGVGEGIRSKVEEYVLTGASTYLMELKEKIPAGFFDLIKIPGMGAKKILTLHKGLGIQTIGELEYACQENRLISLSGFGAKSQQNILQNIQFVKKNAERHLFSEALTVAEKIVSFLKEKTKLTDIQIAGSLRRCKETVKDIDLVASSAKPEEVIDLFVSGDYVERVEQKGQTKANILTKEGMSCDLRVVSPKEFPFLLHHLTGSKEHNTAMRALAKKKNLKMNEYGLFPGESEKSISCKNEEDIFGALGLSYIPPELREDRGEIQAALEGRLPTLIQTGDLKGLLHIHSVYSDGTNTIEELATTAQKEGYEYIAICDHSQTAQYANGLKEENIERQHKEIDRLNRKLKGIQILKGIEADIRKDGTLDYPERILKQFDFVIGSVHSSFLLDEEAMTLRILKAIENPYMHVLGHPTGRILLSRESYKLNMRRVIEAAAKNRVAIELNANPHRLDVDWRWIPEIKKAGGKIAICPDAHHIENFSDVTFGIGIARKGWTEKEDVINCLDFSSFKHWLKNRS